MSLKLKNNWQHVANDKWDWEVYLVSDDPKELDEVDYVKYILHSTFVNPIRIVKEKESGFKLKTNGWGTFMIKAFAHLKNGRKKKLKHYLQLELDPPSGTSSG